MLPILLNPIVTKWTDSRSPKEVFVVIPLLCAIGLGVWGPPPRPSGVDARRQQGVG